MSSNTTLRCTYRCDAEALPVSSRPSCPRLRPYASTPPVLHILTKMKHKQNCPRNYLPGQNGGSSLGVNAGHHDGLQLLHALCRLYSLFCNQITHNKCFNFIYRGFYFFFGCYFYNFRTCDSRDKVYCYNSNFPLSNIITSMNSKSPPTSTRSPLILDLTTFKAVAFVFSY